MYPSHIRLRLLRATASSGAALVVFAITLALPTPRLLAQSPIAVTVRPAGREPAALNSVAVIVPTAAPATRSAAVHRPRSVSRVEPTTRTGPEGQGQPQQADPAYKIGNGITSPVLITKVDPSYTTAAMAAKIQGEVWLDGIVEKDGTMSILSVTKSLDPTLGLDQSALSAASKWKFKPGTKDGQPVRVAVQLILEFRLGPTVQTADTPGIVAPVVRDHPDPVYTSDAMRAKIQGTVKIEAVVQANGTVGSARVVESLDQVFGLDESALTAARRWTFEPGTLNGTAVPVRVVLSLEFRLH